GIGIMVKGVGALFIARKLASDGYYLIFVMESHLVSGGFNQSINQSSLALLTCSAKPSALLVSVFPSKN
ncbi:MAG: hypothetical protein RPU35_06660, partial [Candidatus Sedimenticola sp. (ex Thyasira tokunagai)]